MFNGLDNFHIGKTKAITKIIRNGTTIKQFDDTYVGICQIRDMDIVANACTVPGRIIIPENLQLSTKSQNSINC
ncbi:hypothetical protein KOEU_23000 [Komagataeibacter europaeus]|uniref:Uncharacterized protein n=1 Tax=Komagataeibacter europaeus TaxID=33995 RepID=A0A0M0EG55_KOMEU|nr:hypothetical protein KOEU_23000 [Komagataeibacter europaeus]